MREKTLLGLSASGFHRLRYVEWGAAGAARTVVCVHGLTRNSRDFDFLAQALAGADRRVVCPDVAGRGQSGWLADPGLYGYPQYLADAGALIARLDVDRLDWVGTSMGGFMGMLLAAQPRSPIRRLVLNDIGPAVPKAALERIAGYVAEAPSFPDLARLEAYLREIFRPFGSLDDRVWRHLAEHSARRRDDCTLALAFDPAIGEAFKGQPLEDVDIWPVWAAIGCPTLVLRGAESDVLPAEVAARMAETGPRAEVVEVAGCGHAPPLADPVQIDPVRRFLDG